MNVLIAVDGSNHTHKMLDYLARHKGLLGANPHLTVVTVHQGLPGFASRTLGKQAIDDYHREESEAILKPVSEALTKHGFAFTSVKRVGTIAQEILAQATESAADMIVMGAHGHSGLQSLVLGSVTQKVLAQSTVPVLVVR